MALFEKRKPDELLVFLVRLNITLKASGNLASNAKRQYIFTLPLGEALCYFNVLRTEIEVTTITHLNQVIFYFGTYFYPANVLSKQNRVMQHSMRNL